MISVNRYIRYMHPMYCSLACIVVISIATINQNYSSQFTHDSDDDTHEY